MKKTILRFAVSALLLTALFGLFAIPALAASYDGVANTGNLYELEIGDTLHITNPHSASNYGLVFYDYYWSLSEQIGTLSNLHGRSTTFTATEAGTTTIYGELDGSVEVKTPQIRYNPITGQKETYYIITHSAREYLGTATIKVRDTLPPEITSQPSSTYAASGKTASVTVKATDHSALKYQWYYYDVNTGNTVPLPCTTATYSCTMSSAVDGRMVCCMVTDAHGNHTQTDWVQLSLLGITQQPKEAVAELGTVASTSLKAEGAGLTYQWYIAKKDSSSFSKSSITSPTYSMKLTADNTGRQAYCVITNQYGQSIRSDTVTLRKPVTVKFTTQPQSKFAADGKTVSTTVKAAGDGLTYQWYYKNAGASKFSKASITGPTYSVKMDASRSGRQIYCVVTDKFGDTATSKTVTLARFAITQQPADVYVDAGMRAAASVTAEGDGLTYQWYIKAPGGATFTKSSITGNTYGYNMTKAKDDRQAYCIVTDKYGNSLTTKTVTFHLSEYATIHSTSAIKTAAEGSRVSATVEAAGDGLKYQWYIKSPTGSSFSKSSITGKTYSYDMTKAKSGRQAYCVVTDRHGTKVQSTTFTFSLLDITDQSAVKIAGSGGKVSASVNVTGDGLKYQWYIKSPTGSSFSKSSITSKTYSYAMTPAKSGRQAYCVITDKWGNSVRSDTVTFSLLAITKQPSSKGVGPDERVSTTVNASGDGLTYQWYVKNPNNTAFSKSSIQNATYSYAMTAEKSGRQAYCVITDKWGNSIRTNTVAFSLLYITRQPADIHSNGQYAYSTNVQSVGTEKTYQWYLATPDAPNTFKPWDDGRDSSPSYCYLNMSESFPRCWVYCVITDAYGVSITTDVASCYWLGFKQNLPDSKHGARNQTLSLPISYCGEDVTYQWYVKGPQDADFVPVDPGSTTYTHTVTQENSGTQVKCLLTNKYGATSWSQTCTLRVLEIVTDIKASYRSSGRVSIHVDAIGDGLKYQWYISASSGSSDYYLVGDGSGGNTSTMSWYIAKSDNGRIVYCNIYDANQNCITTRKATLNYAY